MTTVPPMALICSSQRVLPTTPERLVLRLGLTSGLARKPVTRAPRVPPTPWTPKVGLLPRQTRALSDRASSASPAGAQGPQVRAAPERGSQTPQWGVDDWSPAVAW